ncbi:ABC transporter permease [Tenggerimyces flavus]|uniref:ABC transporter permease n=1 Tax=Tenggerimyces flavus TaxID=1708749 RepID=A0ABV7YKK8_9ACTN|nr:FtsX-like permease family protein [Tenggerimyces flavus]MBM7787650.1 hypothetical protein [Tenggerimyces flavus]
MSLLAAWMRLDVRRRWRSLVVLALLVAISTATVLTAVAGARRGASAADRLLEATSPAHYAVVPNRTIDWEGIRRLPEVEALGLAVGEAFTIDGVPADSYAAWGVPLDDQLLNTLERPVVLAGRLAAGPDEAVVTSLFLPRTKHRLGDEVTLRFVEGRTVRVRIVGVVRSFLLAETPGSYGGLIPGRQPGDVPAGQVQGFVRLRNAEADLPAFTAGLAKITGRTDIDVWPWVEAHGLARRTGNFDAAFLLAFGIAAFAAALIVVGQAVARHVAAGTAEFRVLSALGMTIGLRLWCASVGPGLAAMIGAAIGVGGAVAGSRWMPLGNPALFEPVSGIDVDPLVLGLGWLGAVVLVTLGVAVAARWSASAETQPYARRSSAVARVVANSGLPVPVVLGTRFALERGRGSGSLSVRPALVAAVLGVVGVLAAFTLVAGVAEAVTNPARGGQVYQLQGLLGFRGAELAPAEEVLGDWSNDQGVLATTEAWVDVATSQPSQRTVNVYKRKPITGDVNPVLTNGRMPEDTGEIAIGPHTARTLGVEVGGTVQLSGSQGDRSFEVVGIAFVPEGLENYYHDGAWLTESGFGSLFSAFKYHLGYVSVRPGVSVDAVKERLTTEAVEVDRLRSASYPLEIREAQVLPITLSVFLALIATGAVGHALVTAIRNRRSELAVLRALGMSRRQCRATVAVQAFVLAGVGLVFGVPLGVALGRLLWRMVTNYVALQYVPPMPFWPLLLCVPGALLVAYLLAVLPGERAARMRVGQVLRAE